jgi:hypothetical protein
MRIIPRIIFIAVSFVHFVTDTIPAHGFRERMFVILSPLHSSTSKFSPDTALGAGSKAWAAFNNALASADSAMPGSRYQSPQGAFDTDIGSSLNRDQGFPDNL